MPRTMLLFTCLRCGFQCREFGNWASHLWEVTHQEAARKSFLDWGDEDNFKSLVLYTPSEVPPPLPSEMVELFIDKLKVMMEELVCWTNRPRMFVVQFPSGEEAERVLRLFRRQSEDLKIGGELLQLRRKSDVLGYEWPLLLGGGSAGEAPAEEPLVIEIADNDNDDGLQNGRGGSDATRRRRSRAGGNENGVGGGDDASGSELEPELVQQPANGQASSSSQGGEEIKIRTKMSSRFAKTFLAKIKPEKDVDDKNKMKGNFRWMEQQWADIYLGFHDKLWPVCFAMGNSEMTGRKDKSVGFEVTFKCTSRKSDCNKWLRKKIEDDDFAEVVNGKTDEFYNLLCNETECNRIRKHLKPSDDKPVLGFTCHIIILYHNKLNTTAELTFSNFKGKEHERKIRAVEVVFTKLFKQYEKMKIDKWNASVKENTPRDCKEWKQIINIE